MNKKRISWYLAYSFTIHFQNGKRFLLCTLPFEQNGVLKTANMLRIFRQPNKSDEIKLREKKEVNLNKIKNKNFKIN